MSLVGFQKKSLTILMIVVVLTGFVPSLSPSTALAQAEPAFVRRLRAIETSELGISYPAGLAFSPGAQAFYVLEARGPAQPPFSDLDILQVTPFEDRGASARITASIRDPINVAYDPKASRLLVFQAAPDKLIEILETPEGSLDPATLVRHDARHFGLQDPQGMVVDPASGHLLVLDASGPRIVRIEPDADGGFAGALISEIDLSQAGLPGVRGLTLDPNDGHFHLFSPSEQKLYELTALGQVVAVRDLSGMGLVDPQGLVLAPSADLTDDPSRMNLYIADSGSFSEQTLDAGTAESSLDAGVGNGTQGSGNITELSFTRIPEAVSPEYVSSLVQTIDTSAFEPPSPDTAGITYIDESDTLMFSDSEVNEMPIFTGDNLFELTTAGDLLGTSTTIGFSNEPTGMAYNPANGHVFVSQDDGDEVFEIFERGADGQYGTEDPRTSFDTNNFGAYDAEGIAFDSWQGVLYLVDGINSEVYRIDPGHNGVFDGRPGAGGDDQVTSFDTARLGFTDPEGIAFNSYNGNLFVVGNPSTLVAELTPDGDLVQTIDISAANADKPAGLAYAPASYDPNTRSLYIAERGVDNGEDPNENDGKIYEVTLPPMFNVPPLANDDSASTVETAPVIINVADNDTDPNGNLDPSSANITCGTCEGPTNGGLINHNDGTFTYAADPDFLGNDSFVYEICDTEAECDTATVTIGVTGPVIDVRVSGSSDDAEESSGGSVGLTSSDLELVFDGSNQTVGMRFNGINLPQGANITNAYIQFHADETQSGITTLTIEAEANDNAATFVTGTNNVSSRPRTIASVPWSPAPWTAGAAGPDQRTPNIAPVIQQIVNRSGWASGNSLVLIITGTGKRVADSYDGYAVGAPLLHIEFSTGAANSLPLAADDGFSTDEDTPLSVAAPGVLDNDTDGDGDPLAASLVSDVSNGSLALNANGSFTYTPDGDYTGTDSFTYRANDGLADSNVATVSITVNAVNDAPVAADEAYTTQEDTPLSVAAPGVLGNDTDADGDPLTANLVSDVTNGSLTLNDDGSFTYDPNSGFVGGDGFTYQANDGGADSNIATVTITVHPVNDAPLAVDDGYSTDEDTPLSVAAPGVLANDTDGDGDGLTAILVSGVSNGSLALNDDGSFNYTPDGDYTGTDSFTYRANDGLADSNEATVSLTVNAINDAPVAADDGYTTVVGTQLSVVAPGVLGNDTDADGDALDAILVSNVSHGSLALNAGGSFTYNPSAGFIGSDSFTYRATDDSVDSNIATVTLTVSPLAPTTFEVRVRASSDDAEENPSGRVGLTSSDLEMVYDKGLQTVGIRFTGVTIPQGATITDAYVQFQAEEVHSGATALTIQAEATDDAVTFDNVTNNISNRPRTTAAASWNPPAWVSKGDAGPDQRTPPLELVPVVQEVVNRGGWASGNSLAIIVSGTGERAAESYNGDRAGAPLLHVEYLAGPPNGPPVANDDSAMTPEDTMVTINVSTNDTDPEGSLNLASTNTTCDTCYDAVNGSLTNNGNGSFTYTPDPDYNGPDSFVYEICDSGSPSLCDTASVSITVDPVNDPPLANDDSATTAEDTAVTIDVADNDTDPDGNLDPSSANVTTAASNGTVTNHTDGTFTYSPDSDFTGVDSFVYEICDGSSPSLCDTATVSITVTVTNDPPVASDDSATTLEDTAVAINVAANDDDADGNLDPASTNTACGACYEPTNGTLTNNGNGTFGYEPGPDYYGADSFVYEICDDLGACDTASVSITVDPVNDPPLANDDTATTLEGTAVTIDVVSNDSDVDGNLDPASIDTACGACSDPANGALTNNGDGSYGYTPDPAFSGPDSFVYQICDLGSPPLCDTASVAITVNPSAPETFEARVNAGTDDAEEKSDSTTDLTSSDLELIQASSLQTVGIRFNGENGVMIPQGATILSAYVQFQVDEITSGATALTIQGEAEDNAPTFTSASGNVTSRTRTTAAVPWTPAPWSAVGEAGPDQRTPDIAPVLQEIVDRPGWTAGNSLVIIISGSGSRVAESYEGSRAGAPLLFIEYLP